MDLGENLTEPPVHKLWNVLNLKLLFLIKKKFDVSLVMLALLKLSWTSSR